MEKRYIIKPQEHFEKTAMASRIAAKFFELSYVAAQNGGFGYLPRALPLTLWLVRFHGQLICLLKRHS